MRKTDSMKTFCFLLVALLSIVLLFLLNLASGSVSIPLSDVVSILTFGKEDVGISDTLRYIVIESRLPQALMALFGGAALAVSGLLLQTAFRNPLAGPDVFGINSGAALSVSLVMLAMGGSVTIGSYSVTGYLAVLLAAFVGAMFVTGIIFLFSTLVKSSLMLLIIGLMIGYVASSIISLLNFFATAEGVKSYMVWGFGSFGNVGLDAIPVALVVILFALMVALCLVKPLNALLLGESYAANLGVNVHRFHQLLLILTGILTATVTAFCGPISFIGLATPHIARLLMATDNHRKILPMTLLLGSVIALFCNWLSALPCENGIIPLNAITPLLGAPIIIYVLLKHKLHSL